MIALDFGFGPLEHEFWRLMFAMTRIGGAMLASLLIGLLTSLAVGIDRSLADLLSFVGAKEWAQAVGGLLTLYYFGKTL